jgi:hypothetical protein
VKALNNWIKTPSQTNMFFLVSKFLNLVILVGKKLEKMWKFKEKCKQQKNCKNFEITNLKGKKVPPNE